MRYVNKEFTKKFSSKESFKFIAPADFDEVLEKVTAFEYEKDEHLPYWADIWPSSEALFKICCNKTIERQSCICELGAGLGLISAAIAKQNPTSEVISTDINFEANIYANENFKLNRIENGNSLCCDWRFSPFKKKFNLILGADILYEERWIEPVLMFIKDNLNEGGEAIISDPQRKHWGLFLKRAKILGFKINPLPDFPASNKKSIIKSVVLIMI